MRENNKVATHMGGNEVKLRRVGPAKIFDNITHKLVETENSRMTSDEQTKRDEIWSKLANQVVGAENLKD